MRKQIELNEKDKIFLREFAENNMVLTDTAKALGVTGGSLQHRLIKIHAMLGLNPRRFYDLVMLLDMINGN